MTGKKGGFAAKIRNYEQCENIQKIHRIYHLLAFLCSDTGGELKFVKDFELTIL